jgi:hypothetical protein
MRTFPTVRTEKTMREVQGRRSRRGYEMCLEESEEVGCALGVRWGDQGFER